MEIDADFSRLRDIIESKQNGWSVAFASERDSVAIYKKKTDVKIDLFKAQMTFKGVSKDVAFELISNLNIRKKWDKLLNNLTIIDQDIKKEQTIFHYVV